MKQEKPSTVFARPTREQAEAVVSMGGKGDVDAPFECYRGTSLIRNSTHVGHTAPEVLTPEADTLDTTCCLPRGTAPDTRSKPYVDDDCLSIGVPR